MRVAALEFIESTQRRKDIPEFRPGDSVRVNWKVKEGDKERVQAFEGVVIRKTRGGVKGTFTVRKVSYGVGVERIFPIHSPRYESIDVLSHGAVRRSRLFYLRALKGKASRIEELEDNQPAPAAPAAAVAPATK